MADDQIDNTNHNTLSWRKYYQTELGLIISYTWARLLAADSPNTNCLRSAILGATSLRKWPNKGLLGSRISFYLYNHSLHATGQRQECKHCILTNDFH